MTKHSEQFKLKVVQDYLSGTRGYTSISTQYAVNRSAVARWVSLYQVHGTEGLTKKFRHYSAQFRLSVLQHMWDNELCYGQVAAVFNIRSIAQHRSVGA